MQVDFLDAHKRHLDDAERLFKAKRWANADHLYGMAAECGLKRLMLAFGMPFDSKKRCPKEWEDKTHVNKIWERFEAYRCGHPQGSRYVLPPTNPFHDWEVSQRYAHQSHFDKKRAQAHRSGAKDIRKMVERAQKDGLI